MSLQLVDNNYAMATLAVIMPNAIRMWSLSRCDMESQSTLIMPKLQPPDSLWAPMSIVVNSALGFASYLVMRDGGGVRAGSDAMLPLAMYAIQVAVHNVWPYVFFQKKHLAAAAVWSSIHCGLSALTVNMFYRVNHMAGQLAVPALAWSAFCTYVCVKLYQLNKPPSSKKSS